MRHGLAGHNAIVALFRTAFPEPWWQIEDLIAEGDRVVARMTMTGTRLGDFFGVPATGRAVTLTGAHILRIADDRIAEHWGSNDDLGLMRRLGVIPEPSPAAGTNSPGGRAGGAALSMMRDDRLRRAGGAAESAQIRVSGWEA
jgi:predicted ester cyclase